MPVVRCPGCDRQLNVPDTALRVKCPQCGQAFATTSDGITAGGQAGAAAPITTTPAPSARRERDAAPADHGSGGGTILVVMLAVVAALFLFAVVGGGAAYFFMAFAADEFRMEHDMAVAEAKMADVEMHVADEGPAPTRAPWTGNVVRLDPNRLEWDSVEPTEIVPRAEIAKAVANTEVGPLAPKSDLWKYLAVEIGKNTESSALVNGRLSRETFRDVPEEGALLIGFYTDRQEFLGYLQPIYLTSAGEKLGPAYGKPNETVVRVKARPGYAVGELTVRAGDLLDGMGITFMKVTDTGLNAADSYRSAWHGGRGGSTLAIGGDGSFLVGIHGRLAEDGGLVPDGSVATLGAVRVRPK